MQIDTHIIDFINDIIDTDNDDKPHDQVTDPRYALKEILQYCPKKLTLLLGPPTLLYFLLKFFFL